MHLFDWKARRAGGRITVVGKDPDGNDAKIVGVDVIMPGAGGVRATDKHGVEHLLAC